MGEDKSRDKYCRFSAAPSDDLRMTRRRLQMMQYFVLKVEDYYCTHVKVELELKRVVFWSGDLQCQSFESGRVVAGYGSASSVLHLSNRGLMRQLKWWKIHHVGNSGTSQRPVSWISTLKVQFAVDVCESKYLRVVLKRPKGCLRLIDQVSPSSLKCDRSSESLRKSHKI